MLSLWPCNHGESAGVTMPIVYAYRLQQTPSKELLVTLHGRYKTTPCVEAGLFGSQVSTGLCIKLQSLQTALLRIAAHCGHQAPGLPQATCWGCSALCKVLPCLRAHCSALLAWRRTHRRCRLACSALCKALPQHLAWLRSISQLKQALFSEHWSLQIAQLEAGCVGDDVARVGSCGSLGERDEYGFASGSALDAVKLCRSLHRPGNAVQPGSRSVGMLVQQWRLLARAVFEHIHSRACSRQHDYRWHSHR